MSILDKIAPRKGYKQRRLGTPLVSNVAKTLFYVGVPSFFLSVALVIFFDKGVELPNIPATRTDSEVLAMVHEYLKETDARTIDDYNILTNCWTEFGDAEFTVEYFSTTGIWRVNAYYRQVRYYWRVDDSTMTLTRDLWFKPKSRTIKC
ncbi:MAG TPA: hypothetical protein QF694_06945 [Dehalococcoidia bacterium]|jgi:hypothetical protein|nr:hypothetical protein [Chloroflexota bacterium]MDP6056723.1 hypothetical protein [Dehalococcoidia bacterium]MDP7261474.1 hypothetical protein [Dehalococcoidia bacterium]MDP7484792.1 hypothetical protein [Dehalococcoidia bacterium]HJP28530.1 hypothetical protein [Dehalococcoidia bacterium]|tara:strand:- start:10638 stop:11084 length:447 start_codon:yes stop_codon:yes gene_type:complete